MALIESTFKTPFGWLDVEHDGQHIYSAQFSTAPNPTEIFHSEFCNLIRQALESYNQNPQYRFQLPLKPSGTPYQKKIWNALLVIPAGRTVTYGELAATVQSSPRAIGQACRKNPVTLFIPCHRVVGKASLGGYMGKIEAIQFKMALLDHEGIVPSSGL